MGLPGGMHTHHSPGNFQTAGSTMAVGRSVGVPGRTHEYRAGRDPVLPVLPVRSLPDRLREHRRRVFDFVPTADRTALQETYDGSIPVNAFQISPEGYSNPGP